MKKELTEERLLEIYDNSMQELYGLVLRWGRGRKALAEDIVQETYLRALRSWEKKGVPDDPGAWLRTVAKNLFISQMRKDDPVALEGHLSRLEEAAAVDLEKGAELHFLERALGRLRQSYRQLIEAFHLQGKTMKEIAREEDLSVRAVEGRLRRARRKLKEMLSAAGVERE